MPQGVCHRARPRTRRLRSRRSRRARSGQLDLAELDPEAADLDLVVDAPEELEAPVRPSHGQGHRCDTGGPARRTDLEEALGSELGPVEIAPCDAGAADEQLAGDADRDRLAVRVEELELQIGDRPTDRARAAILEVRGRRAADRSRAPSSR